MPKIPRYQKQAAAPESTKPFIEPIGQAGQLASGVQQFGKVLSFTAERFQSEKDYASALTAVNAFSDENRMMLTGELQKQQSAAIGSHDKAKQWYVDAINKYGATLNRRALVLFKNKAFQIRDNTLSRIAGHEAAEHQNHMKAALSGAISSLTIDIRQGMDLDTFRERLFGRFEEQKGAMVRVGPGILDEIDIMNPYQDNTVKKLNTQIQLSKEYLIEVSTTDPMRALKEIEQFRDVIPENELAAIVKKIEQSIINKDYEEAYNSLKTKFGSDYNTMIKTLVSTHGMKPKVKSALLTQLRAEFQTLKSLEDQRTEEQAKIEGQGLINAWNAKDLVSMKKILDESISLSPDFQKKWYDILEDMTLGKDTFTKDNSNIVADLTFSAYDGKVDPETVQPIDTQISIKTAEHIREIAKQYYQRADLDTAEILEKSAIQSGMKQIKQGSAMLGFTPESEADAYHFATDLRLTLRAVKDPKKRISMLTPDSSDYILHQKILPYKKTFAQQMDIMTKKIEDMTKSLESGVKEESDESRETPKRLKNETIEEWQKRTGLY